jgi:ribosomal protein S18 acetylase RimI-like enzyme
VAVEARTKFHPSNPHIRQIDPWRDGRAVANLLEVAFREEADSDEGERLIHALRNYSLLDALLLSNTTGFVWVEDGLVIANASIQRNVTRRDTWVIGNVATQPAYRNRGIGRAVVEACIQYAAAHGARYVALQADVANYAALHLYEKLGFQRVGEVVHFLRTALVGLPLDCPLSPRLRSARWSDRELIWTLAKQHIPEALTFAEPFNARVYRLGLRWTLVNALSGNPDHWLLLMSSAGEKVLGAVRTRAVIDGSYHYLEVFPTSDATQDDVLQLVQGGLNRLAKYVRKPIYAAHVASCLAVRQALQAAGFRVSRTLVHMRLTIDQ